MIGKYASLRRLNTEDRRKLIFKYVRKGIEDDDVKENYFSEKDLKYIFNMYVNIPPEDKDDVYYMDFFNDVLTLLNYYREQKFNLEDTSYKEALNKRNEEWPKPDDELEWGDLHIADPEHEAKKLVEEGKINLNEPLSEIKERFEVTLNLSYDYLTKIALYRMYVDHKKLEKLTEDDLKIILVHDFPKTDYTDHRRILTDEEVKSLSDIFNNRGRHTYYTGALRYLLNNGNWKKMESILKKE
jgi:hypothetical protein